MEFDESDRPLRRGRWTRELNFLGWQAAGDKRINFDTAKFIYIGNPNVENNTTAAWHTSGIKTIDDAKRRAAGSTETVSDGLLTAAARPKRSGCAVKTPE